MADFTYKGATYRVDAEGFLLRAKDWDENFAEGTAPLVQIFHGLTEQHWRVIKFVRRTFDNTDTCPRVHETCQANNMRLKELKNLFPTGYLRGVCRLAGVSYKESFMENGNDEPSLREILAEQQSKTFVIDANGFLIDPDDWTERYAFLKADEMKMPEGLTDKHWQIIHFLRDNYKKNKSVPTVYETCEAQGIDIEELKRLFPDGYHRGAVKLSGLRVR